MNLGYSISLLSNCHIPYFLIIVIVISTTAATTNNCLHGNLSYVIPCQINPSTFPCCWSFLCIMHITHPSCFFCAVAKKKWCMPFSISVGLINVCNFHTFLTIYFPCKNWIMYLIHLNSFRSFASREKFLKCWSWQRFKRKQFTIVSTQ